MIKKIINNIINFIKFTFSVFVKGFYETCLILSKGFYFYFYTFFYYLGKLFKLDFLQRTGLFFKKLQKMPVTMLIFIIMSLGGLIYIEYIYIDKDTSVVYIESKPIDKEPENSSFQEEVKKEEEQFETNLYRKFGSYKLSDINFNDLKSSNEDVVAWLIVDGTNVNYPIVQSGDNDYYLNHDFNDVSKISGWTFMDFRNSANMDDKNTIFYGHNLYNKTAFGSISNLFTSNWFKNSNHKIVVVTENAKYTYVVFSVYYKDPEIYYLTKDFSTNTEYQTFLDVLKSRSRYDFKVNLNTNDKIITLSTCTDDNTGRKVVHAKLIKQENI